MPLMVRLSGLAETVCMASRGLAAGKGASGAARCSARAGGGPCLAGRTCSASSDAAAVRVRCGSVKRHMCDPSLSVTVAGLPGLRGPQQQAASVSVGPGRTDREAEGRVVQAQGPKRPRPGAGATCTPDGFCSPSQCPVIHRRSCIQRVYSEVVNLSY